MKRKIILWILVILSVIWIGAYIAHAQKDTLQMTDKDRFINLMSEKAALEYDKKQAIKQADELAKQEQAKIDAINAIRNWSGLTK